MKLYQVNCQHAPAEAVQRHQITCAIGAYDGPAPAVCRVCAKREPRHEGPAYVVTTVADPTPPAYDGSHEWASLYALAVEVDAGQATPDAFERHLDELATRLPVFGCGCQPHFTAYRKAHPREGSRFDWTGDLQNDVNRRLGREAWSRERQRERWL